MPLGPGACRTEPPATSATLLKNTVIMCCGHVQVDVEPNDTSQVSVDWLTALPAQGSLPAQSKAAVVLHYDFRGPVLQGIYNADVLITTSGTPAAMVCHHVDTEMVWRPASLLLTSPCLFLIEQKA